eukprot:TRINITY_DN105360_c0_g1_i1.p1 TRINITY_DN105360_c0_g1~~TRINITY_DN105360_c0_g1_i1.p1  ORF type:complete len:224 (+),score=39.62 TRINITY_DN105360_c0_g1_i1:212-883(+)
MAYMQALPTMPGPMYAAPTIAAMPTYAGPILEVAPTVAYAAPVLPSPPPLALAPLMVETYAAPAPAQDSSAPITFQFHREAHNDFGMRDFSLEPPPPAQDPALPNNLQADGLLAEELGQLDEVANMTGDTPEVMERQIQELVEGQRAIRKELEAVKAQINENYTHLEELRRVGAHCRAQHTPASKAHPQMAHAGAPQGKAPAAPAVKHDDKKPGSQKRFLGCC